MKTPLVSIIVPVYNTEKYLRKCLDSIQNQTFTNWECILVNDGSTDKSGEICDEYAQRDTRFHSFHKENEGVSTARNLGIQEAKGEYICFLDSDDYIRSNLLEGCLNSIGNADLLIFSFKRWNYRTDECILEPAIVVGRNKCHNYLYTLKETHKTSEFFCFPWNKMYKKSILVENEISFPTDISFHEDEIFVYRYIPFIKELRTVADIYVDYNDEPSGLSARKLNPIESLTLAKYLLYQTKCDNSERSKTILFFRAMTYMQDSIIKSTSLYEKKRIANDMIEAFEKKEFRVSRVKNLNKLSQLMLYTLQTHSVTLILLYTRFTQIYRLFKIYVLGNTDLKRWRTNV